MKRAILPVLLAALALATAAPNSNPATARQSIDPADFSATITNPLMPLSLLGPKVFLGEEEDDEGDTIETRLESKVLPQTTVVAGVRVLVLEERAYEDGELVEVALDYFAQHKNGDVYYFGERVDNYEDGKLKDHAGQWLAGESGAQPGVIMPAAPKVGETLSQELAPGIAEDKATVLSLSENVKVPAGTYSGCLKTREFSPLEPGIEEFKWHCPGAGLVKEGGDGAVLELVSISLRAPPPATATPQPSATVALSTTPVVAQPATVRPPSTGDAGLRQGPTRLVRRAPVARP